VGGGVFSETQNARLSIDQTTITGNSSVGAGGGVFVRGQGSVATITNSTISGNTAGSYAGGVQTQQGAVSTFTNVTISGNTAPLWVALTTGSGSSASLVNVTIAGNISTGLSGSAIGNYSSLTLKNTAIQDGSTGCDGDGAFQSLGHNLDGDDSCHLTGPGDMPNVDAKLGALSDNGGPTQTHALLPGSPAIDHGDNAGCPATDQRGYARPADGDGDTTAVCDIGAFEYGSSPTPTPTATPTPTPAPTGGPAPGDADCDGGVDAVDALQVLRYVAGLPNPAGCIAAGNVKCNDAIDAVDALLILRWVAGLPVTLPPGCPEMRS